MCSSLLDLALGVRVRGGRGGGRSSIASASGGRVSIGEGSGLGPGQGLGHEEGYEEGKGQGGEGDEEGQEEENGVCTSLLEVLRQRSDDERPLVRAKALQAFGTALSLRWPKFTVPLAPWDGPLSSTGSDCHTINGSINGSTIGSSNRSNNGSVNGLSGRSKMVEEVTNMLITSEDVSVFFDRCAGTYFDWDV